MSTVTGTSIGGGLISSDRKINRRYFSGILANVTKKRLLYRRGELKTLPTLSVLPEAADAWNLLSSGDKSLWEDAGFYCGLGGYNLFIQDKIYRIVNSLSGNASPSVYHQYLVGHIGIDPSSGHFLLRQVGVDLVSTTPTLNLSYKTALVSENGGSDYLKVRFKYEYLLASVPTFETKEISLNLSQTLVSISEAITLQDNQTGHWELEIEGDLINGDFWFDNFFVQDVNGILTKDPYTLIPDLKFFRLILPEGITAGGIYPPDDL